ASYAFTTLVTTDEYLPAALVVAHSLRLAHEAADAQDKSGLTGPRSEDIDLVALVTPGSLSVQSIRALLRVYDRVIGDGDDSNAVVDLSDANLALLDRPDLGESQGAALTKLHAWRLTDYRKVVYLDADSLVLRPLSHLFHLSATFAASPDTGWPDIFNSGVMLLEPSQDTFEGLLNLAASSGTWDGADQGLINEFFGGEKGSGAEGAGGGWTRLPFTYNMT
ncbi:nucleotide-diphospho-sugar transferase, partial [Jaminaea rosea]